MGGKDAIMTGRSGIFNAEVDEAFAAFITYSLLMLARKNADFIVFKHTLRGCLFGRTMPIKEGKGMVKPWRKRSEREKERCSTETDTPIHQM